MIIDFSFLALFLAIGTAIGLIALPWWKKRGAKSEFAFFRAFLLLWPFLLLDFLWLGCKAYLHAWKRYLHARKQAQADKKTRHSI